MRGRKRNIENDILLKEGKRRCSCCKDIKSLDEYFKNINDRSGYNIYCRKCAYEIQRKSKGITEIGNPFFKIYLSNQELLKEGKKKCCHCKEIKTIDQFHTDNRSITGLTARCKICWDIYRKNNLKKYAEISNRVGKIKMETLTNDYLFRMAKRKGYTKEQFEFDPDIANNIRQSILIKRNKRLTRNGQAIISKY